MNLFTCRYSNRVFLGRKSDSLPSWLHIKWESGEGCSMGTACYVSIGLYTDKIPSNVCSNSLGNHILVFSYMFETGTSFSLSYPCLNIIFPFYCSKTLNPGWGNNKIVPVDEMKACRKDGGTAPLILNHSSSGMAVSGRLHSPAALPPRRNRGINWKKAGWTAKPVWVIWRRDTSMASVGIRTPWRRTRTPVTVSTELSRLHFFYELINVSWIVGSM